MALLEDIKLSLRITSDAFDDEVSMLVFAALADMKRVGIDESYLDLDGELHPLVRMAITCYCKARFGYDNEEADRFDASYRQTVADMLNSNMNIAAIKQSEEDCD